MSVSESGLRRRAPRRGDADSLMIFFHGYGANGGDLIGLSDSFGVAFSGMAFSSPDAPSACPGVLGGRQWFPLVRLSPDEASRGVESTSGLVDSLIDSERSHWGVSLDRVVLFGFSQGAMIALGSGFRRGASAVLGFSGMLASVPSDIFPPIFLAHGDGDDVISASAMFASCSAISSSGGWVRWRMCPGLGHGIDSRGIDGAIDFLRETL